MEPAVLFFTAAKWLFLGLIYLVLFVVVLAVRREMRQRLAGPLAAPAVAPGRLRLLRSGSDRRFGRGQLLVLGNNVSLGAADDNDLVLADQYISNHHARLRWDGAAWWVEDLGSRNGTFVDDHPCPPGKVQTVPFGGRLALGDMVFELLP